MRYRAVVLDVDGTLVDSNDAHAHAWVQAFADSGRHVEFSRVRPLIGMGGDKVLPQLAGISDESPEGQALTANRSRILERDYLDGLKPTPGAHALLERFRDEHLTLVVASSAKHDELSDLLRIANATKLVDALTSSDDAENSKPDPDIVDGAIARIGCAREDIVMLGDTPYDVEAARRAGIDIIALRCGGWSDADLAGAIAIYDHPQDLLDQFELSPFHRQVALKVKP